MTASATGLQLVHALTVSHAVTGEVLGARRVRVADDAWPYWRVLRKGPRVLFVCPFELAADAPPTELRLQLGHPLLGRPSSHPKLEAQLDRFGVLRVVLPAAAQAAGRHELSMEPAPLVNQICLLDEHGRPLSDQAVEAVSKSGTRVPLPEIEPGFYRAAARVWDTDFYPYSLQIQGRHVAHRVLDYDQPMTSSRLVVNRMKFAI